MDMDMNMNRYGPIEVGNAWSFGPLGEKKNM